MGGGGGDEDFGGDGEGEGLGRTEDEEGLGGGGGGGEEWVGGGGGGDEEDGEGFFTVVTGSFAGAELWIEGAGATLIGAGAELGIELFVDLGAELADEMVAFLATHLLLSVRLTGTGLTTGTGSSEGITRDAARFTLRILCSAGRRRSLCLLAIGFGEANASEKSKHERMRTLDKRMTRMRGRGV